MSGEPPVGARIAALGHYLPAKVVTSTDVAERLEVNGEWIVTRTGIRERRIAEPDESVVDMATLAAAAALDRLRVGGEEAGSVDSVDTVIVATSTPLSTMPSTAARVAFRLGLPAPAVFDLNNACAAFCYALGVADALVRAGTSGGVLVIGADKSSAVLDWHDRDTAVLFADGAGAAVVLPHERRAVGPVLWGSVAGGADLIAIDPERHVLRQDGRVVYRWAIGLGTIARQVCLKAGVKPEDLTAFVPHQANLRIIDALANALKLDERAVVARDVVETGNTMAASIPIALSRLANDGPLAGGGTVLLFGFGAGLAYAGQVVDLGPLSSAA
jgi:3-oxoacyl-[acyl-carrier-protein] synthase-3